MPADVCTVCHQPIMIQINKGSGICSERCRKAAAKA
jgi:predicted nucleic acid-binding Zn ribbon protein